MHPTGFLDPSDLAAPAKVLCGEMMRGVGGVLLSPEGRRFVDELRPRDKVVEAELAWADCSIWWQISASANFNELVLGCNNAEFRSGLDIC